MRYSRVRKSQSKRYAAVLMVILLTFVILYIGFAGTLGKYVSQWILPFINGEDNDKLPGKTTDDPVLTPPDNSQEPASDVTKVTEAIKANALTLHTIQMGAFTDLNNAESYAQDLRAQGGAGYILKDDFYRVLAVAFKTEEDARKVKTELAGNNLESHIYKLATAGAEMNITATEENVSTIRSSYEIWEKNFWSLEQLLIDLDSSKITTSEAYDRVSLMKADMEEREETLRKKNSSQNNNIILSGLVTLYEKGNGSLDKILSQNSYNKVAISAEIKYTYIDMLTQYKDYMDQITNQQP